jgi:aminoglycoside phosphotransferase (APT) family kinase protein
MPTCSPHTDVHGHNVLLTDDVDDGLALLDWEGAHRAAPDLDLDMFLRWAQAAHYPELFAGTHLRARLEVYDAQWHLVQLLFDAHWRATHPELRDAPPARHWAQLRPLVEGHSHLDDFGDLLGR